MQLTPVLVAAGLVLAMSGGAAAQSLSPMREQGPTPSNIKGFRVQVGNPYKTRMVFVIVPMDARFETPAKDAVARPNKIILAPNTSRSVLLAFKINPDKKERTIGACVIPQGLSGTILPRVCGTYRGVMLAGAGG